MNYFISAMLLFLLSSPESAESAARQCPLPCVCAYQQLDCYGRNLQEIPQNVSNSARYVNLKDNQIQTISPGLLTKMTMLESLFIGGNQLTRLESGTFVNMTRLRALQLADNQISTVEPDTFVNLPSLEMISLNNNLLSNITGLFVNVPSLARLMLGSNQLTELTQDSFAGLDNLQYLVLSQNKITTISDSAFSNLTTLTYLVLRGNPIQQANNLWGGLSNIHSLDISYCQLTSIPTGLPQTLKILKLGNNAITTIRTTYFRSLRHLTVLYFENNIVNSIQQSAFSNSPHLYRLMLSGNKLLGLPTPIPANIAFFNADNNNITHIFQNNFDHDSKMKDLSLKNNSIRDLAGSTFSRLGDLARLSLESNSIQTMHNMTFQGLRNVEKLSLDANPIREIQFRALGGLSKLNHLTMSELKERVIDIKGNFFRSVQSVNVLDLHESPSLVKGMFKSTDMMWSISSLKYLNLMSNNLTYLPPDLNVTLPNLKALSATDNPWRCDADLKPLREWMEKSYRTFIGISTMVCASPPILRGRRISDVKTSDFKRLAKTTTTATTTMTMLTSTNSKQNSITRPTKTNSDSGRPKTPYSVSSTSSSPPSTTSKVTTGTSGAALTSVKTTKQKQYPDHTTKFFSNPSSTTSKRPKLTTKKTPTRLTTSLPTRPPTVRRSPSVHTTKITWKKSTPSPTSSMKTHANTLNTSPSTSKVSSNDQPTSVSSTSQRTTQKITGQTKSKQTRPSTSPYHEMTTTSNSEKSQNDQSGSVDRMNGNQHGGSKRVHALSPPAKSSKTSFIIGISAGFACLALVIVVAVLVVRHQKLKKKNSIFADRDISFATHQEDNSDTVCILDHLHESAHN